MPKGAFPALLSGHASKGGLAVPAPSRRAHSGGACVSRQAVKRHNAALERAIRSQRR